LGEVQAEILLLGSSEIRPAPLIWQASRCASSALRPAGSAGLPFDQRQDQKQSAGDESQLQAVRRHVGL